ncbi:MAG: DUF1009 domain-containing protein, partial [Verrucomicrobiales bacterium]
MSTPRTIGVIAGNGLYPEIFITAARRESPGVRLVAAAFKAETKENITELSDECGWFRVGQMGKIIKYFKKHGVSEAVMI